MSFKYILLDKKDGIATITFHRPEALNALNSEVLADLDAVVDDVIADDEVRVVVFTGEGKSFIAGADIKEMDGDTALEAIRYSRKGSAVFRKIELMDKPTIAAVNGYAFGGGFEFVLCTDIRFALQQGEIPSSGGNPWYCSGIQWDTASSEMHWHEQGKRNSVYRQNADSCRCAGAWDSESCNGTGTADE